MTIAPDKPTVSIITATYNRSRVLACAIRCVQQSTYQDYEHIIIGDCCTDDTEAVVNSFDDPRIRFMNLKKNYGGQSGPNNEGFKQARGKYVAFLNHDDLWFQDHLETVVRGIERTEADLVFTLAMMPMRDGHTAINGGAAESGYAPNVCTHASLWLMKRELMTDIGHWRHHNDSYVTPSQDVLIRAWKAGKDIRQLPHITVLMVMSGDREGSYAKAESAEYEEYCERISRDHIALRDQKLQSYVLAHATERADLAVVRPFRRGLINFLKRIGLFFGVAPIDLACRLLYWRKGAWIKNHRKRVGITK